MNGLRILLADDHPEMGAAVERELGEAALVVGVVHDGDALLKAAEELNPDVILLDISMPRMNGFEAARLLLAATPERRIIFLTMHDHPLYIAEAFLLGGRGYVLKRSAQELPEAIGHIMQGKRFLSSTLREAHPELLSAASGN